MPTTTAPGPGGSRPGSRTALITGASSGIGRALARVFAANHHDLVLVARTEGRLVELGEELARTHGVKYTVIAADLARPGAAPDVAERLRELGVQVDVLVNSAGFGLYGPFARTPLETERDMIQVNVAALTALTKLLLPGMLARRGGGILNVASTAAFQPGPLMAVYYATKAYVLSFGEALARELAGTGVTVTTLCPGPTSSAFQATARLESSRLISRRRLQDADKVARAGFEGLMKGRPIVIPGLANRVAAALVRLLPRRVVVSMVHWLQRPN